jgi:hypothetical protein
MLNLEAAKVTRDQGGFKTTSLVMVMRPVRLSAS